MIFGKPMLEKKVKTIQPKKVLVLVLAEEKPWVVNALLDALRGLDKKRFEVHLHVLHTRRKLVVPVCSQEVGFHWKEVWVHPLAFGAAQWLHRVLGISTFLRYLGRQLRGNYAIGMGINGGALMDLLFLSSAKIKRRMLWIHTDLQAFAWFRQRVADHISEQTAFERRLARADVVLAGSRLVYRACKYGLGLRSALQLLYPPLDRERVLSRSRRPCVVRMEPQVFNMVAVGELSPAQGFDLLIEALALVKRDYSRIHLYLVGEGKLKEFLKEQCMELGLSEQVTLLGTVDHYQVLIGRADLFISSAYSESYSLPLVEALLLGKPVLATHVAGNVEVLENGIFGLLCHPDKDALADAIKRLIADSRLRKQYAQQALHRAAQIPYHSSIYALEDLFAEEE